MSILSKLVAVHKASDFDALDKTSPFFGAVVDERCDCHKISSLKLFPQIIWILSTLFLMFPNAGISYGRADTFLKVNQAV